MPSINQIWRADQRQSFAISLSAAMAAILLLLMATLVIFILRQSSGYFWPATLYQMQYVDENGNTLQAYVRELGEHDEHVHFVSQTLTQPFSDIIVKKQQILEFEALDAIAKLRLSDGRSLYVSIDALFADYQSVDFAALFEVHERVLAIAETVAEIRRQVLAPLHQTLADLNKRSVEEDAPARLRAESEFVDAQHQLDTLKVQMNGNFVIVSDGQQQRKLALNEIADISFPNQYPVLKKTALAAWQFLRFMLGEPQQANTSGGVFPALFGTVLMVLLMTIIVTPLGILAAIYLHEYAPTNGMTSVIRISVNNLAGVPSIVYGVFGLGFLVYTLGGTIDHIFFSADLPNPTLGTPGLFWASLTMAILTLPVVIVATEEGLRRVPQSLRRGSYALGATQAETILYTVIPIASPGIVTGMILAIARAAGEVAPLILVGAVKFAPALPLDGQFPFLHLDRQFMHLGVMIYDGAFHGHRFGQGSNFMFAACLLLLLVVLVLNVSATLIRARLRRQFANLQ